MHPEKDDSMVDDLLSYKEKLDSIIKYSFNDNNDFKNALKDAFSVFINKRQDRPAELLAKYIDKKLRAGNKVFSLLPLLETLF